MKKFLVQHKYHLIVLATLLLIAGISGYQYFKILEFRIQNAELKNTNTPNQQLINATSSTTNNKYQITDNNSSIKPLNSTTSSINNEQPTNNNQITSYKLQASDYARALSPTSTVYDLMMYASADSRQPFLAKTKNFPGMGEFVEEINGLKNDNQSGKYWIYYVNGESAKLGISEQIIKPNDIITWKYETTNM